MALFDFASIKRSVQSVGERIQAIRGEIERLKRERENIATAPAAKADVKDMVRGWANATADRYLSLLRVTLDEIIRKPADMANGAHPVQMTVGGAYQRIGGITPGGASVDGALCAFFGPMLVEGICKAVDQMEWPKEGLPMAERGRCIKELDKKIEELIEQESELVRAAQHAGIILE